MNHIPGVSLPGLSRDPSLIHFNSNSGAQGVNLLAGWGFKKLILLGLDMRLAGGKRHFFGDHPKGLHKSSDYPGWCKKFARIASDASEMGVEIVNCSRDTALTCFERKPLEGAI